MKLELSHNDVTVTIGEDFDFDSAMDWAEAHGEANDWSDDFNYILTDENGQAYVIEMDSWAEADVRPGPWS